MSPLIYILLAVVAVAFIAYAIVNLIPKKMHWILSILFLGLIVWMSSLLYGSIMKPINFKKKKIAKYAKVIDHLKMIKDAEVYHRKVVGGYIDNPNALIKFIDTAKEAITQTRTVEYTVKSGSLDLKREKRVVDTLGYKSIKDYFKKRDYKNMFHVPGTDAKFTIKVDSVEKSGLKSQVFKAYVAKDIVLAGMDKALIEEEKKALGGIDVSGTEISVGSLSDVKVTGNWPPFYDNKDRKEKK